MAAKRRINKAAVSAGVIGWIVALLMFFPILWMLLAAFKTEIDAVAPQDYSLSRHWRIS